MRLGQITEEDGGICVRELTAIRNIQERLNSLQELSVTHADLGFSNILVTGRGLVPIDFSFAGYAHPAQEAGMLMSNYPDAGSAEEILRGFAADGEQVSKEDAQVFLSCSVLLLICMQHAGNSPACMCTVPGRENRDKNRLKRLIHKKYGHLLTRRDIILFWKESLQAFFWILHDKGEAR